MLLISESVITNHVIIQFAFPMSTLLLLLFALKITKAPCRELATYYTVQKRQIPTIASIRLLAP